MNSETFEKTVVAHVETLAERDALDELLKHPLLEDLPRVEGYPLLGSYVLFAQLGKGGMANVFRGLHVRLDNEVAIKIRTAPPGSSGARFQREASVAARLEHQNLVRATDVNEFRGLQYMVLDYIDGEDADERVARKGKLGAREALTIVRDAALGLAEAHRLDFIHRDIKPANVMISRDGRVKVADLGLAKSVDDDLGLTATGGLLGTPMYMAPEQFRRSEETCKASDVYGLGVTAYFLLTGGHPFDGKSIPEIMNQVCVAGVPRLDQALPELDARVVELVQEIVALEPRDRPADGAELAAKITPVLESIGGAADLSDAEAGASKARGVCPPTREMRTRIKAAATAPGPATPERIDAPEPSGREPRSKLPWIAAAMVLVAGGGTAWSVWKPKGSPERREVTPTVDHGAAGVTSVVETAGPRIEDVQPGGADALDLASVSKMVMDAQMEKDWGKAYGGLLEQVRLMEGDDRITQLVKPIEDHSMKFLRARRYRSSSELLDEAGRTAVVELAKFPGLYLPWTAIIAAELGVEFNGLKYVIDQERKAETLELLHKAQVGAGDDELAEARVNLLRGVIGLDDLMNDHGDEPLDTLGPRVHDDLVDAAQADPSGEAAAWLGVLYLELLERCGSEDEVPRWFKRGQMLELLRGSIEAETSSRDAAYVMGHICSDGLAGEPKSLEKAREYYILGARQGHVGCIGEAIAYGAAPSLERRLDADAEKELLHFAQSDTPQVAKEVRRAYALAALTGAFEDPAQDRQRRLRAIEFLQKDVAADLADKLDSDAKFDRVTICLAAMFDAVADGGLLTREDALAWIDAHEADLAKEIYSPEELPARSGPIWAVLVAFDIELATEVLVIGAGAERREKIEAAVDQGLFDVILGRLDPADYAGAPYVWSLVERALEVIQSR